MYECCQEEGITFARLRPYRKNDSAHVEQKNWTVVRQVVGYDRQSSKVALEKLGRVCSSLRLYVNFFRPVMKLKHKSREGAKVRKVYDEARTPYQRLLHSGALPAEKRERRERL